jgi:hypothetical protein
MRSIYYLAAPVLIYAAFCSCGKATGPVVPQTDSFTVTVNHGFGGGKYKKGDTVHIFSDNYGSDQLFGQWTGDTSLLDAPYEWHTWFIMPAKNVSFNGSVVSIQDFSLNYVQIKGRDRPKPVYYYFPPHMKGLVYLLHGTGGNATHVVNAYEWQQLIKSLVTAGYGVLVTECEESTVGQDINGDGKIRWDLLPYDSVANVDLANIRLITEAFYANGDIDRTLPQYDIGMSDGGFFAGVLASYYHYKAEINYCAQGADMVVQQTTTPLLFCMARFDQNENVGSAGNQVALSNSQTLAARGVCSGFLIKERSPLYPERFARSGARPEGLSADVFAELQSNGFLDARNYFKGFIDDFLNAVAASPGKFPVFIGLSSDQKQAVTAQIDIAVSDHHMYSDLDHAAVAFLDDPCH